MTPPPQISTISSYPQNIFIFLKPHKNIEIQKYEPPKMVRVYVYTKVPPPPTLGLLYVCTGR